MKILSQDKDVVSTLNHIGIKEETTTEKLKKKTKKYIISNQVEGAYGITLGTYKSKERALEIIKEIYGCSTGTYAMPEK